MKAREHLDLEKIHRTLGPDGWVRVLYAMGMDERQLKNQHGPCPICGGKDRYRFDNKRGRGDYYCGQCGAGDGITLVMRWQKLDFVEACNFVIQAGRIDGAKTDARMVRQIPQTEVEPAKPTDRVRAILRQACMPDDCDPARKYLQSRGCWPLPAMHKLRAHPCVDYWQEGKRVGRYAALIASVRDLDGQLVTAHVTYLEPHGAKIQDHEARKIMSPMKGRTGCACRLMLLTGETLGIAEGIETALSASSIHGVPVWATLNTSLLQKFEPPPQVKRLIIFSDRDVAGLAATSSLMQRLQGRVKFEFQMPQLKDWNDALMERL